MLASATPPADSADAIARLGRGHDPAAWAWLVERHGPSAYRLARRILGDDATAEDACQEAFVHVRLKAASFIPRGADADAAARAWVIAIAGNVALTLLRSRRSRRAKEAAVDPHSVAARPPAPGVDDDLRDALHRELAALPERHRRPLLLAYAEGMDHASIAAQLGVSVGNARVLVHRALERLRARMERHRAGWGAAAIAALLAAPTSADAAAPVLSAIAARCPVTPPLPTVPLHPGIPAMTMLAIAASVAALVTAVAIVAVDAPATDATPPVSAPASLPLAQRTWVAEGDGPAVAGQPVGIDPLASGVVVRLFQRQRGGGLPAGVAALRVTGAAAAGAGGAGWRTLDGLGAWCRPLEIEGAILQALPTSDRKGWRIVRWKDGVATATDMSSHPDASYVHQTHVVRTADGTLHAMAGIHAKDGKDHYEHVRSPDGGATWSAIERVLDGASAHDDIPTVCRAWGERIVFTSMLGRELTAWARDVDGRWATMPMPSPQAFPAAIAEADGRLGVLSIAQERGAGGATARLTWTWRREDGAWDPSATIIAGLVAEDALLQLPPSCIVRGRRLLVGALCPAAGGGGHETARLWCSEDAGATWNELATPPVDPAAPTWLFAAEDGEDIVAIAFTGTRNQSVTRFWRLSAHR